MAREKPGLSNQPAPGTRVRLTGYFLKATGQQAGGEGHKRWTVMPCGCELCRSGRFVAIDEPATDFYDDVPPEQRPKWRHVAIGNLMIVGAPPRAADQPEEVMAGGKRRHASVKSSANILSKQVIELKTLLK
jgi:hypothetical protein